MDAVSIRLVHIEGGVKIWTDDKRLLQAAAVIGKDVPFGLLRDVADQDEDALRASLGRLPIAPPEGKAPRPQA